MSESLNHLPISVMHEKKNTDFNSYHVLCILFHGERNGFLLVFHLQQAEVLK